jgi:long-chain acyl-CoA synthetase
MLTLPQAFFQTAARFGNRTALRYKPGGDYVNLTFPEVEREVREVASALLALQFQPGDRAAILMENRPQWITSDLGIMLAGGVCVPIHTTFSARLIASVLKDSGSRFLFVAGSDNLHKIAPILDQLPGLEKIIYLQAEAPSGLPGERFLAWEEFLKQGVSGGAFPQVSSEDLATIVYTSGTTGDPKGVRLTHRNLHSNAVTALQAIPITHQDTLLSILPLSHSLPRMGDYYAALVTAGATLAFAKNLKELAKNLAEVQPTIIIAVPRLFESIHDGIRQKIRQKGRLGEWLLKGALKTEPGRLGYRLADALLLQKIRQGLGGRLIFAVSGAAALNPYLTWFFRQIGIKIIEGYGLTEASPVVSVNRLEKIKIGTVGLPLEGVEVRLGEDRELLVRGPNVTAGYWNNPQATREILEADGWLHTGDLARQDEEGYLTIVGRKKEIIVTASGKNVWPDPLEAALKTSRYILQALVLGEGQTQIAALIVPNWTTLDEFISAKGISGNRAEILKNAQIAALFRSELDRLNLDLAEFERIARFTLIEREFTADNEELTPSLKLVRRVIGAHYASDIGEMFRTRRETGI